MVAAGQVVANKCFNGINMGFPSALARRDASPIGTISIPEAKGTQDYFGFNYYTRNRVTFDLRRPETLFGNAQLFRKDAEKAIKNSSPTNPMACSKV
jgi:hypothetical protein